MDFLFCKDLFPIRIRQIVLEGNKNFHVMREFFKITINYSKKIKKLKGIQLQQSIS
jgi:hypothetical protein